MWSAEDLTFSEALPIATPRPAHSIMSMSLGLSPTAMTSSLFYTKGRCQVPKCRTFASVWVADFAEVIVGVHGGQGAVEVGIHHGRYVAYRPCVSGYDYLGRRETGRIGRGLHTGSASIFRTFSYWRTVSVISRT